MALSLIQSLEHEIALLLLQRDWPGPFLEGNNASDTLTC